METATHTYSEVRSESARQFLTADEVGRELGIATTSVYDRLSRGDLAYHRVGRLVRVRRHDLDAFIARTRIEARPPRRHAYQPEG